MAPCAEVRSSSPTSGGGFVARGFASCRGGDDRLAEAEQEIAELREVIALHEGGSAYAHRLAIMLECALLDRPGTWEDGHALLDEYRRACREASLQRE
jgi:hypothetical protein